MLRKAFQMWSLLAEVSGLHIYQNIFGTHSTDGERRLESLEKMGGKDGWSLDLLLEIQAVFLLQHQLLKLGNHASYAADAAPVDDAYTLEEKDRETGWMDEHYQWMLALHFSTQDLPWIPLPPITGWSLDLLLEIQVVFCCSTSSRSLEITLHMQQMQHLWMIHAGGKRPWDWMNGYIYISIYLPIYGEANGGSLRIKRNGCRKLRGT